MEDALARAEIWMAIANQTTGTCHEFVGVEYDVRMLIHVAYFHPCIFIGAGAIDAAA